MLFLTNKVTNKIESTYISLTTQSIRVILEKSMESSEPPPGYLYLAVFILLLATSAFFSASESAFLAASRLHLRYLKEKGDARALRVGRLLRHRTFFLNSLLVGNNAVNIALSSLATSLAIALVGPAGVGAATAATTIAILVFGEVVPKAIALSRPESIALKFSRPLSAYVTLSAPAVAVISAFSGLLGLLTGSRRAPKSTGVTEDDLRALIEVGEEDGVLESGGGNIMQRILDYTDLSARDIMTPRTDIVCAPLGSTRRDILELSRASNFSRFPVYGEDIDDIRGIVNIKDVFLTDGVDGAADLMRPALFVFETQRIPALQELLHRNNQNCAIVIDEFGGTAGLVTTENIFEEIFGSIRDEYDREEATRGNDMLPDSASGEAFSIPGSERLDSLNERLGTSLASGHFDTIAGYLMERAGEIPAVGFCAEEPPFSFTVESRTGNRIDSVRVERTGAKP